MKRKLLYALCAVTFVTVMGLNIFNTETDSSINVSLVNLIKMNVASAEGEGEGNCVCREEQNGYGCKAAAWISFRIHCSGDPQSLCEWGNGPC